MLIDFVFSQTRFGFASDVVNAYLHVGTVIVHSRQQLRQCRVGPDIPVSIHTPRIVSASPATDETNVKKFLFGYLPRYCSSWENRPRLLGTECRKAVAAHGGGDQVFIQQGVVEARHCGISGDLGVVRFRSRAGTVLQSMKAQILIPARRSDLAIFGIPATVALGTVQQCNIELVNAKLPCSNAAGYRECIRRLKHRRGFRSLRNASSRRRGFWKTRSCNLWMSHNGAERIFCNPNQKERLIFPYS